MIRTWGSARGATGGPSSKMRKPGPESVLKRLGNLGQDKPEYVGACAGPGGKCVDQAGVVLRKRLDALPVIKAVVLNFIFNGVNIRADIGKMPLPWAARIIRAACLNAC